jgi:hypothetical protein
MSRFADALSVPAVLGLQELVFLGLGVELTGIHEQGIVLNWVRDGHLSQVFVEIVGVSGKLQGLQVAAVVQLLQVYDEFFRGERISHDIIVIVVVPLANDQFSVPLERAPWGAIHRDGLVAFRTTQLGQLRSRSIHRCSLVIPGGLPKKLPRFLNALLHFFVKLYVFMVFVRRDWKPWLLSITFQMDESLCLNVIGFWQLN